MGLVVVLLLLLRIVSWCRLVVLLRCVGATLLRLGLWRWTLSMLLLMLLYLLTTCTRLRMAEIQQLRVTAAARSL